MPGLSLEGHDRYSINFFVNNVVHAYISLTTLPVISEELVARIGLARYVSIVQTLEGLDAVSRSVHEVVVSGKTNIKPEAGELFKRLGEVAVVYNHLDAVDAKGISEKNMELFKEAKAVIAKIVVHANTLYNPATTSEYLANTKWGGNIDGNYSNTLLAKALAPKTL